MERAYHRDFSKEWKEKFSWGMTLTLAMLDERVTGFGWYQDGKLKAKCHYIQLTDGEYRAVGGGVLPDFRGQRVHTSRYKLLVEKLFSLGAKRIYIDVYEENIPSLKGQVSAGFRELGRIHVVNTRLFKTYVRWL
jgi:RimJ/RimL family protein N-acetyltransferase